jgi:hypothetical protein
MFVRLVCRECCRAKIAQLHDVRSGIRVWPAVAHRRTILRQGDGRLLRLGITSSPACGGASSTLSPPGTVRTGLRL